MNEEPGEETADGERGREQLAAGAAVLLLLSAASGMLPDSVLPAYYRTAGWLIFAILALFVMYLAFPHMWAYGIWLAGIYVASVSGLLLILLGGERLFASYWAAAGIGALMELASVFLVYTMLMRVRIARSVLESRAPLGLWLAAVAGFFVLSNTAGLALAVWFSGGAVAAFAAYGAVEAMIAIAAVYICWAPEKAVWSAAAAAPAAQGAEPEGGAAPAALLKKLVGRREPEVPRNCPACGAGLKPQNLACPACGEASDILWCGASESYVVPCPSCGAYALSADRKCPKCGSALAGIVCPRCKQASPSREWKRPAGRGAG